jgi:hypothetical protein
MVISPSFSEGTNSAEWLEQITRFVTNSRAVCRSHRSPPHRLGWRRPALPQTYRYVLTGANWDGTHRALIEAGLVKCGEANRARPTG